MPIQIQSISTSNKQKKEILIPIIEDRLYWICGSQPPKSCQDSLYFCVDEELVYEPLNNDFGPFCIENTLQFIQSVQELLNNPEYSSSKLYHYTTSEDSEKKVNSAFLIGAYQILCLNRSAEEVHQKFKNTEFITFRDSSDIKNDYKCTLLDCLKGLEYAHKLKWVEIQNFNIKAYQALKKFDITVVIPNKLIAFQNPELFSQQETLCELTVDQSINIFKQMGVKLVIRLNKSSYSPQLYERNGIKHVDLIFPDGTSPSEEIMYKFLQLVESVDGMVAVHCKAGRGRTGTLIGCYAIKHYHFPAKDFIGYIRIMRPGSIHGPQQPFLNHIQKTLIEQQGSNSQIWESVRHLVEPQNEKKYLIPRNSLMQEENALKQQPRPRSRVKSLMISKQSSSNSNQSDEQLTPLKNNSCIHKGSTLNEVSTASSSNSSNAVGIYSSNEKEYIKNFTSATDKFTVTPFQTLYKARTNNHRHVRNISSYYNKLDQSSIINSSTQINEIPSLNSLQNTRNSQLSVDNARNYGRRVLPSTSKNGKRIVVGRKKYEEDKNYSMNSFYGLDNESSSSSTLIEQKQKKQRNLSPIQNSSDIIFNNLCKLHNNQQTKAQERLNQTANFSQLSKNLISRKTYIIKQYSKPLPQIN
ncbi:tyrosine phosphatase (macronuclear) [Tetrahymena thermophila SB210]|uniref:Tyrosine phosphatase n=1 Tax=Tetrahymena thermophila (strain SB210) TaxID=312017 RepID=I7M1U6_TETTS|nr:tyrosine phosphatase [Tetrahymena thermophila SB210]EAR97608.2 tyrosine phosphatase [Tetrahymena thermophila SB210]|eukprot:XP_001017853.2 tyrosine phosphatase [Tetrahymena thermophila SB210]